MLESLLAELQQKAPRVLAMRNQLTDLQSAHEELCDRYQVAVSEGASLKQRCDALTAERGEVEEKMSLLTREVADRSVQLTHVLDECQRLGCQAAQGAAPAAAAAGSQLVAGSPRPPAASTLGA